MWVEKHRPRNPNTMIGNEEVRLAFLKWLKNWGKKSKPALLLGPPGIGKTTLVHAAAATLGYNVLELNASDVRTKTKLEERLAPSMLHSSLIEEKILIFLDEVDGIYGRQDKGGVEFVQDIVKISRHPIVMAANVEDDKKIQKLMKSAQVFKFQRLPPKLIEMAIKNILHREGLSLDQETLEKIVRSANGDIRAAVNSAQVAVGAGEDIEVVTDSRDTSISVVEAMKFFFNAASSREALMAMRGCGAQPRDKIRVIFQSIMASGLQGEKLVKVLDALSKADKIVEEIGSTQNYRLLRYFDVILATKVFEALKGSDVSYREERLPWPLQLRIWNEGRQLKEISKRLAAQHHTSAREAAFIYLPYVAFLSKNSKSREDAVIKRLQLDESLIKVLRKEEQRVLQEVSKR
jgi:replication factor C large subunit